MNITTPLRVLMVTSEWPTPQRPYNVPFVVRQVTFLRRAGIDVDVFAFRGGKRLSNYTQAWRSLRPRLRTRYDLVHAQWGQSALLALPKALPLIVTFRGDDVEGIVGSNGRYTLAGRCLQLVSQIAARAADEAVAVSESLASHLPRSAHVIPSGLDLEAFRPLPRAEARRQLGLPEDAGLILFAGNAQNPRKRFWLAQAAVEQVSSGARTDLIAATDVAHADMPLYMNACDALLLTSIHEGSPNVVKEALACNLPVVSTNVGDVSERIDGIEGCKIVGDSPNEIAAALQSVLQRGQRVAGRVAVEMLDERVLTEQLITVYRKAIGSSAG